MFVPTAVIISKSRGNFKVEIFNQESTYLYDRIQDWDPVSFEDGGNSGFLETILVNLSDVKWIHCLTSSLTPYVT
jgi:hypothetical protein